MNQLVVPIGTIGIVVLGIILCVPLSVTENNKIIQINDPPLIRVCNNHLCGETVRDFKIKHGADIHPPAGIIHCFNYGGSGYKILNTSKKIQCIIPGKNFMPILPIHESSSQENFWNSWTQKSKILSEFNKERNKSEFDTHQSFQNTPLKKERPDQCSFD